MLRFPARVEPTVAHRPGMEDPLTERRIHYNSSEHGSEKERPTCAQKHERRLIAQEM